MALEGVLSGSVGGGSLSGVQCHTARHTAIPSLSIRVFAIRALYFAQAALYGTIIALNVALNVCEESCIDKITVYSPIFS